MRKYGRLSVALVMILSAMFLTTSCAKKEMQTEQVSTTQPEIQEVAPDTSAEDAEQARRFEAARLLEEDRLLKEAAALEAARKAFVSENIRFAFNSYDLSNQAQRILNNKADYLRMNSGVKVTVEGYCDERGTEAYNISLGQQRAESVKKFLVDQGINTDRVLTISYGENKPVAAGRDESAWAKNRRAQMVINLASADHKAMKN
jgi:peptidoglycan-associated lipoprotein